MFVAVYQLCSHILQITNHRETVRYSLSMLQSYITNHRDRLFVTVYRLYSHILQIIAADCSSRFIDYAVIYNQLSPPTVRHGLSIMQSYITNHRGTLFVTVYRLCSHILQIISADCSSRFIDYAVIYYKSSRQTTCHGLSIMQSYITNHRSRLFVTIYRLCSHILQIISADCSSRFIDYAVIYSKSSRQTVCHGLSIIQSYITNHRDRLFITVYRYAVIYYKSSRQTVRHGLSIMQSYITNHRGRLFVTVYQLCSHILQIIATDCSSRFIDYTVIHYKLQIIATDCSSRFIDYSHILQIIATDCSSRFIDYTVIHYKLQIIATDCSSRFIDYTVIYYKSSRQTVWQCLSIIQSYITNYKSSRQTVRHGLSIIQSYITNHRDRLFGNVYQLYSHILQNTNHRGKLFLHVYPFCSLIQLTTYRGMIYIFQSLTKIYEERRLCLTHLRICRPPVFW